MQLPSFLHLSRSAAKGRPQKPRNQLQNYGANDTVQPQIHALVFAPSNRLCPRLDRAHETHLAAGCSQTSQVSSHLRGKGTGAKAERPALMKLCDDARKGDVVIVWKVWELDRLASSVRQLVATTSTQQARGRAAFPLTETQHHDAERQTEL